MNFLSNLFSSDAQLNAIDQEIENLISSSPVKDVSPETSDSDSSDIIHQLLSTTDEFSNNKNQKKSFLDDKKMSSGIMGEVESLLDKLTIQPDRAARYKVYEEIYASVPIIKRMLKTWLSNLVQKNPVSGKSLILKDSEKNQSFDNSDELKAKKESVRLLTDEIISYFDIVDKLKHRILPIQQLYGDAFVEIINLNDFDLANSKNRDSDFLGESALIQDKDEIKVSKKNENPLKILNKIEKSIDKNGKLNESQVIKLCEDLSDLFLDQSWNPSETIISENEAFSLNTKNRIIELNENNSSKSTDSIEAFYEYATSNVSGEMKPFINLKINKDKNKKLTKKSKKLIHESVGFSSNQIDMSNVLMLIHKPQDIIILETPYGSKLGYVELADKENVESVNISQQLSTIIGRIASGSQQGANSQEEILSRIIRIVIKKIISNSGGSKKDISSTLNSLNPSVYNTIKKLIVETDKDNPKRINIRRIKARFIPIDRMFQFTIPSPDFYPYGVSFIDPLVLQGKLYILSQLSNVIMKLSRAAPINLVG